MVFFLQNWQIQLYKMWLKLFLLTLYLLLLFFLSRLLEAASWYHGTGSFFSSRVILDPFSLSVKKLKQLLDNRGVSYSGVVEKQELMALVEASGKPVQEELSDVSDESSQTALGSTHQTTHFTCGSHFYEEVEDTKDSVWLVQVVTGDAENSLLDDYTWKQVIFKVTSFGVRTGVFRCSLDQRLCARKGWTSPRLILALPRGNKAKEDVIMHSYINPSKSPAVLQWVRQQLTSRVKTIPSEEKLKKQWTTYDYSSTKSEIRVIFFSTLKEPPLFLSSLAIKFTGRVKFGMIHIKNTDTVYKEFLNASKLPIYLVVTPERMFYYGSRPGECYNFKSMELFLKSLRPEINDVFLLSLLLVNAIAGFELFLICGQFWKHFIRYLICVVKYNCVLFLTWLMVLALYQFSFMTTATEISLKLLRIISGTDFAALLRNDWKCFYSYQLLLVTFVLFGSVSGLILRKWGRVPREEDTSLFSNWWSVPWDSYIMTYFFRPMATLTRPMAPQDLDLEEGMELLIERLAVPNLWLQPVIPTDYIKDLPIWKYQGWCEADDVIEENKFEFLSSSEDESSSGLECGESALKHVHNQVGNCDSLPIRNFHINNHSENQEFANSRVKEENAQEGNISSHGSHISKTVMQNNCDTITDSCGPSHIPVTKMIKSSACNCSEQCPCSSQSNCTSADTVKCVLQTPEVSRAPQGMLDCRECSICLESYRYGETLCGLPCGHNYHMNCIMLWLSRDNHCCPVCRWPSYKPKMRMTHPHFQ